MKKLHVLVQRVLFTGKHKALYLPGSAFKWKFAHTARFTSPWEKKNAKRSMRELTRSANLHNLPVTSSTSASPPIVVIKIRHTRGENFAQQAASLWANKQRRNFRRWSQQQWGQMELPLSLYIYIYPCMCAIGEGRRIVCGERKNTRKNKGRINC